MADDVMVAPGGEAGLSQVERVVDTFIAPSKTFADLSKSSSWWLPCILVLLVSVITIGYTQKKIGPEGMRDSILRTMPKFQEQIDNSPPDQAAKMRNSIEQSAKGNIYKIPIFMLIGGFLAGALYLVTSKFGFGGMPKYMELVAVFWYSLLPLVIMNLILLCLMFFNVGLDNYNVTNPLGTNIGYYMTGSSSPVLVALLSSLDLFSIWVAILQIMGVRKVARISTTGAAVTVLVWWVFYTAIFKLLPAIFFG